MTAKQKFTACAKRLRFHDCCFEHALVIPKNAQSRTAEHFACIYCGYFIASIRVLVVLLHNFVSLFALLYKIQK